LLLLQPRGKGLLATALRYKNEVRDEEDYFDDIPNVKVSSDMLKLATHILDTKKGDFKPERFEDRYEDALKALIKAKQQGKEPPVISEPKPSNVINLMDALKRSAKGETSRRAPARRGTAKSHARKPAAKKKVRRAS
jgi:DNA end-binding protein Ku